MVRTVRLGFTGDVMLGRKVDERQRERPPPAVWGTMRDRLAAADGLFVNLECCLSTRGQRWTRTNRPFHFRADPSWATTALTDVGVSYATLANNHVLDFEEVALEDTLDALSDAGIAYAGAGRTAEEAWRPARVTVDGLEVAVVAFTDNTPEYAATEDSPGTAHVDIDPTDDDCVERVRSAIDAAGDPDLLVASLHWGPNMTESPPERFRAFARFLVDEGVDFLHGHSAHVFHGIEVYDGAPILYDTGDFVDDYAVDRRLRNDRGFLFEATVTTDGVVRELHLVPTVIRDCAVHAATADEAAWNREAMRERSTDFDTRFEAADGGLRVPVAADGSD
ncbi:CapA family protein [Halopelagius longus]|uniref:CapA family protein n=1 Tax=Halopelagius longus TaxID=1236180 RepID=A0A1H0XNB0_9EURY|nr:CapA family protein [Halopelagius longus]RDI71940.1 CapA family protein [Halopelagius longus]SDQ04301.1 poly-gamma-glutamate synthesis protein (capsule biosynthesis protein) [Halopelagius longus]